MAQMNFQTQNETFRALLGNSMTYRVPPFQRDYSWGEQEWDDLWADILETIRDGGESAHYMGYLVLQETGEQARNVIDGQQRLTTLSLIILAAMKHLQRLIDGGDEAESNQTRLEQIRNTYIGYLDPVTLTVTSKLTLNRHNNAYYQTYIVPLAPTLPTRGFNASEMALRQAFEWFDRKLRERAVSQPSKGAALASFVDRMSIRLFFTVITVTDELNAYRVFETLNARGVQLSSTDLLKNYLFSVLHRDKVHERELELLDERWAAIVDRLGSERFPTYLRVHWNSRHKTRARESEMFKVVRGTVTNAASVFTLLRDIETDLDTYLMLTSGQTQGLPPDAANAVKELILFRVKTPLSLLLASRRIMSDDDFAKVLRACVVVSFRYNIIGSLSGGDQETVYTNTIRRMLDGEIVRADQLIRAFTPVYPADGQFREAFAEKSLRSGQGGNKKLVRYILSRIERQYANQDIDHESDRMSIEHILPDNPGDGWNAFDDQAVEHYVYRLGNVTLLERSANRELGQAPFDAKRAAYEGSSVRITQRVASDYETWTPETVESNQRWMAKQAAAAWRITQLSDRTP